VCKVWRHEDVSRKALRLPPLTMVDDAVSVWQDGETNGRRKEGGDASFFFFL